MVRLEPSWADFAKVAQKRVDGPVEESLAIALFEAIDAWLLERYG